MNLRFSNNYMIKELQNFNKNISNKSCQCPSTDYWADDTLED